MLRLSLQLNTPDEGDSPENRYDCDYCAFAPEPDEVIVLFRDSGNTIHLKLCLPCAWADSDHSNELDRTVAAANRTED